MKGSYRSGGGLRRITPTDQLLVLKSRVADPNLLITDPDPDPTWRVILDPDLDPDPALGSFRIRIRILVCEICREIFAFKVRMYI